MRTDRVPTNGGRDLASGRGGEGGCEKHAEHAAEHAADPAPPSVLLKLEGKQFS